MKTTQMMMQSLNERKKEYDEKIKIRRRRLSIIAAFAAAVLLIASISVGSILIANRAGQLIDTAETGTQPQTVTDISAQTCSETERDNEISGNDYYPGGEPYRPDDMEIDLIPREPNEITGNGLLCRFEIYTTPMEKDRSAIGYQINLTSTEGVQFVCEPVLFNSDMDVFNDNKGSGILDFYHKEIRYLIPDGITYGEIHIYLNLIYNSEETVSDFSSDPHIQRCFSFAKYADRLLITTEGEKTPLCGEAEMLKKADEACEKAIYGAIYEMIRWDFVDDNFELIEDERQLSEEVLAKKSRHVEIIEWARSDNEARFQQILQKCREDYKRDTETR